MSARGYKQTGGYFAVISATGLIAAQSGATVAGFLVNAGTDSAPLLSTNVYATSSNTSTLLATAGTILKDMGKNLVSSGRVFRKVQIVIPTNGATAGIAGLSGSGPGQAPIPDYLTGYVEMPNTDTTAGTAGPARALVVRMA
jgi:hypothetical protein